MSSSLAICQPHTTSAFFYQYRTPEVLFFFSYMRFSPCVLMCCPPKLAHDPFPRQCFDIFLSSNWPWNMWSTPFWVTKLVHEVGLFPFRYLQFSHSVPFLVFLPLSQVFNTCSREGIRLMAGTTCFSFQSLWHDKIPNRPIIQDYHLVFTLQKWKTPPIYPFSLSWMFITSWTPPFFPWFST